MISDDLAVRFTKDLAVLLQDATFRRVISYMFYVSGMDVSAYKGNSKDIYYLGMRAFAIQMKQAIDYIDKPTRTAGMEYRQMAEREYMELQLTLHDHLKELMIKSSSRPRRETNGNQKDK